MTPKQNTDYEADKRPIVAFCGKAQAGKDTAANYLVKRYGFDRFAFADELKDICTNIFGWDGKKDDPGRALLQNIGYAAVQYNEYFWPNRLSLNKLFLLSPRVVVSDCRFPHEVSWIREQGGHVIHIRGRGGLQGEAAKHASEVALDTFDDWDYVIDNSGAYKNLYDQIDQFLETYALSV